MYAPAGVKTNHNEFPIPDSMRAWVLGDPGQLSMTRSRCRCRRRPKCWCASTRSRSAPPIWRSSITARRPRSKAACRSTRTSRPATNTWARWWRSAPASTNTTSASASRSRSTPAAASASAAARACTPRATTTASITATSTRAIAPTASPPMAAFANTRSTTSTRWSRSHDEMSDEEGTLVVTAGTAMYALTELGGLVAGESVVRHRPGPDRPYGGRGGESARRPAGDPHRHARQPSGDRQGARRRRVVNIRKNRTSSPR